MAASMIHTVHAPAAIGPYSQAVLTGGLLLTSGQLGLDPETGILPEGVEAQAAQALENIGAILEAGFFGDHKPARSCVEVSALPKGGLVEIEATAAK